MIPLIKLFAGIVLVAGIGSAIGVPLSMHSVKESSSDPSKIAEGGDNPQASTIPSVLTISKCQGAENNMFSEINYGSSNVGAVCGFLQPTNGELKLIDSNEKYSELLQKMGFDKQRSGDNSTNEGKAVYCNLGSKGLFASTVGGKDYLGLCDGSIRETQKWITVENKNSITPKIEVCVGICFEGTDQPGDIKRLNPNEKIGIWSAVKFKKKS